jgi:hypothetical protein
MKGILPPLFTGKLLIKFQNILRNTTQAIIRHRVKILDQRTVIFSRERGGITICAVLDQNRGNVMFYKFAEYVPILGGFS